MSAVREPQIDAPELLTRRERARDTFATALMWGIYLYLWVPLISLFAWLLGFEFAYDVMVRSGGSRNLGGILVVCGVVVVVIFLVVTVWSVGNRLKYGGKDRRHTANKLSAAHVASYFGADGRAMALLRSQRSVSIDFDDDGRPLIDGYSGRQNLASAAANMETSASDSQA